MARHKPIQKKVLVSYTIKQMIIEKQKLIKNGSKEEQNTNKFNSSTKELKEAIKLTVVVARRCRKAKRASLNSVTLVFKNNICKKILKAIIEKKLNQHIQENLEIPTSSEAINYSLQKQRRPQQHNLSIMDDWIRNTKQKAYLQRVFQPKKKIHERIP